MTHSLRRYVTGLATLILCAQAHAFEAGWMQIQTPGATADAPKTIRDIEALVGHG